MAEILLIAPMHELAELARTVCEETKSACELDICIGRMEEGVKLALEAEEKGYQVIISRGVTAYLIKKAGVRLPVVDVLIGGYDILKAFFKAKKLGGPIGIVDVEEIILGVSSLEESVGEKLLKYTVKEEQNDIIKGIATLKEAGAKVVIGKIAMANEARRLGMQSVVISSGKEALMRAIFEAERVLTVRKLEKRKAEQIKAILDFTYDGIIALDVEGRITVFNHAAEKVTGWSSDEAIGHLVTDVIPKAHCQRLIDTGKPELGEILEIGRVKVVANRVPIIVDNRVDGVVTTFQPVDRLQTMEHKVRRSLSDRGHIAKYNFNDILGDSPALREVVKLAREYSIVDSTVLILGATGSGKEMFAHSIHNASQRRNGPFIAINCAALPENLLESELFGYVEGAFTGARKGGKAGVFELAHGGTLFLDEVGEMSAMLQARLLRVLEEGEIMRLGDNSILPVNVRLVAATHRNLRKLVEEGTFREDLFYRLNVLSLRIPPLNRRGTDILLIARRFLDEFSRKIGRRTGVLTPAAQQVLLQHSWPGNIRELRNTMERLVMLAWGQEISAEDVSKALATDHKEDGYFKKSDSEGSLRNGMDFLEQTLIEKTLADCGGNKSLAAKRLGISRTTLWRKINDLEKMSFPNELI
jgi:transcriptional regulator, propionate catabolism operon regulatory protein